MGVRRTPVCARSAPTPLLRLVLVAGMLLCAWSEGKDFASVHASKGEAAEALRAEGPVAGEPVELTTRTLDAEVRQGEGADLDWLLVFYAPGCQWCKRLLQDMGRTRLLPALEERGVRVAFIDGTRNRALASRFQVNGYPSIFLRVQSDGRAETYAYSGQRSKDDIMRFATGGFAGAEKLSPGRDPFGVQGRAKGFFYAMGERLGSITEIFIGYGFTRVTALGLTFLVLVAATVVFFILLLMAVVYVKVKNE